MPRGLQTLGVPSGCTTGALLRAAACRHAVMDEKSTQIGASEGMWVGAGRLEGCRLDPISSGLPRRGASLGDTWELGPRRYPFVLIRCLNCSLAYQLPTQHLT